MKIGAVGATAIGTASSIAKAAEANTQGFDKEYDVVIIGLGGAGACAAIEAHDAGASVVIIEKDPEDAHFPNTRMSGGFFHRPDPNGDHDALVEYCKAMMSGENCPWKLEGEAPEVSDEMAKMYADGALETADFLLAQASDLDTSLMEVGGDASFPMFPGFEQAKYGSSKRCCYANWQNADDSLLPQDRPRDTKSSGEAFYNVLVEDGLRTKRPDVDILFDTPATDLVMEDGEITGVVATQGGKELRIGAKRGVVLACGGFEYNAAMRRAFLEGPGVKGWTFYGSTSNTGDGIEMAQRVGAALAKVGKAASRIEVGVPYGECYEKDGLKLGAACAITSAQNSMIVDNYGKRYDDESIITDSTRPYRYQFYKDAVQYELLTMSYPRIPSWIIFDDTLCSSKCAVSTSYSNSGFGILPWGKDNQKAVENGWILKADTIEELAEKILADPENRNLMTADQLVESVKKFNEYCDKGQDEEFGRVVDTMAPVQTAPFYAMKLYPGGPNTKGGIEANAKRQVLDWAGNPIPRLYTAGEISSVFKFTYQAGGNLTECIVCGRVAGQNVAAEKPRG